MSQTPEHFDVLIIGAGLSGVGAAYHLQKHCPDKRYAILEGRERMGGTWDLFRYPGVRSDSDMYTLGYRFRPWRQAKAIADGPSILDYVKETADHYGIRKNIRYNHWVSEASWSTKDARWTVTAIGDGEEVSLTCNFVWMCAGYYRYDHGYTPEFEGVKNFRGSIVHPQLWPENLDYKGKRIVVIGSGATAVTLIPSMADEAEHIVMLQRSPTYMFSMPAESPLANFLRRFLPVSLTYRIMRWQRITLQQFVFKMARAWPERTKKNLLKMAKDRLPEGYDLKTHFTPDYNPWDQRLCLVPDDDLFDAISSGKAEVVTDHIDCFAEDGILLKSGKKLKADIVVTATGLALEVCGGAKVVVDGKPIHFGDTLTYKGLMYSDVPNLASVFGYTNASWTLRADLVSDYVCRLLHYVDRQGYDACVPRNHDPDMGKEPFLDFSSGYVRRATPLLPKQGSKAPWRHPQNYATDMLRLRYAPLDDGYMEFLRKSDRLEKSDDDVQLAAAE